MLSPCCHSMEWLLPEVLLVGPQLLKQLHIWLGRGYCEVSVASMTAKWAAML